MSNVRIFRSGFVRLDFSGRRSVNRFLQEFRISGDCQNDRIE
jgi:hypothetical protein